MILYRQHFSLLTGTPYRYRSSLLSLDKNDVLHCPADCCLFDTVALAADLEMQFIIRRLEKKIDFLGDKISLEGNK